MENKEEETKTTTESHEDSKNKKNPSNFIIGAVAILVIVIIITLATIMWNTEQDVDSQDVLAKVGDTEITMEDIRPEFENIKNQYEQQGIDMSEDKEMKYSIKMEVLQNHINQHMLLEHFETLDLEVSKEDMDKEYEMIMNQFSNEAEFEEALGQANITKSELEKNLKDNLAIQLLIEEKAEINITDEDIENHYEQLKIQIGDELPPLEEIRPQLEQEIRNEKMQEVFGSIVAEIEEDYEVEIFIEQPQPTEPQMEMQPEAEEVPEEEMEMMIEE